MNNKYGHFSPDGLEYIITRPDTPRPWVNYLTNENYCALCSHTGGGYSFIGESGYNRLTREDPGETLMSDRPGRYIYIRDNDSKQFWAVNWQPVMRQDYQKWQAAHGLGYTKIASTNKMIESEICYFVPRKDNVEFWKKVSRMGNDICREAKLFSLGLEEFCAKENANIESKNILINQSYDLENIKFTDIKIDNMSASSFDDAINNDAGIDFGLNSFLAKDSSESKDAFEFPVQDPDDSTEFASFDIDFDTNIIEENGIDVIDRVIIKESDNNYETSENLTDLSSVIEPNFAKNSFDKSFDSDTSIAELDNKDFDHISMDNYEIKLDLAKASIDMIDTKSAQDNGLVEVLQTVRLSKKRK